MIMIRQLTHSNQTYFVSIQGKERSLEAVNPQVWERLILDK